MIKKRKFIPALIDIKTNKIHDRSREAKLIAKFNTIKDPSNFNKYEKLSIDAIKSKCKIVDKIPDGAICCGIRKSYTDRHYVLFKSPDGIHY